MAFKIKKLSKGRPKSEYKVRSIKGITPKGFDDKRYKVSGNKIIFRRIK
jgi:hypothetical protein